MRIQVTEENITKYGLDVVTGNHRVDLLNAAKRAKEEGRDLWVNIPDVIGGDTEAPTERNAFEHYDGLPEPDGFTHSQDSISLAEQAYLADPCFYQETILLDGTRILKCVKHGAGSKHSITADSVAPCIVVDPYDD